MEIEITAMADAPVRIFSECQTRECSREAAKTQVELPAVHDDKTEPGIVEAYRPPHDPSNDARITLTELRAIGSEQ